MPRIRRNELPDFKAEKGDLEQLFRELPTIVGTMAVNFYDGSFDREGFINKSIEKWAPRKGEDSKVKRSARKGLLIDTGELRKSIDFTPGIMEVTIFSDKPYAAAHNEGFKGTVSIPAHVRKQRDKEVKAHSRKMNIPQRQFIGKSELLEKRIDHHVEKALDKIFKNIL
ncbi:MAG: phage virion morphogenesis protein [Bacteroidota bacterium]|nr:phage virion morphogenesis protein [Bacteroidota bacterium]